MMKRKRRTRILVDGDPAVRRRLADSIRSSREVIELESPNNGLVMITMRETARRRLFHLGEVMVTEAKVEIDGTVGLGIITGDNPDAAADLAVIDAACNAGLPECDSWTAILAAEEARLGRVRRSEEARLLETRVRFETMDTD
jgi:alpha-D-ribose 1-methylphosphonate 5-triphosphate synthase subunit PhnG